MWRSKKFIIVGVLAAVLLVGSIGGVALAQTENDADTQPEARCGALLDKVCDVYNTANPAAPIDCDELKAAFTQAQSEMRTEALQSHLQNLVEQGKIDQDQADEYLKWMESKPDVPFNFGFRGHGGFRGMCGPRGWGGRSAPTE